MFRSPRQKALYEVIKSARSRLSVAQKPAEPPSYGPEPVTEEIRKPAVPFAGRSERTRGVAWPKFNVARFGLGKIVLTMPYSVGAACLFGIILVVLVAFRLGQLSGQKSVAAQKTGSEVVKPEPPVKNTPAPVADRTPVKEPVAARPAPPEPRPEPKTSKGDNVVIIATYKAKNDLVPVQEHFAAKGLATEIVQKDSSFLLITKDRYENIEQINQARQKIRDIGASYQAPKGYESFKPNLFRDAYGMKMQ